MTPQELGDRTATFALDVTAFVRTLKSDQAAGVVIDQLVRCATSVAANYRAAGQSRSHAEFTSRISVVLEEADECIHWLEFSNRAGLASGTELERLVKESKELAAIFGASRRTAVQKAKLTAAEERAAKEGKSRASKAKRGR